MIIDIRFHPSRLRDKLRNSYLGNEINVLSKCVDLLTLVIGLILRLKVNGSKEGRYYLCVFLTPEFIRKITCHWRKFKVTSWHSNLHHLLIIANSLTCQMWKAERMKWRWIHLVHVNQFFFVTGGIYSNWKRTQNTLGAITEITASATKLSQNINWREECLSPYTLQ